MTGQPEDHMSEDELIALGMSEDRRLNALGIDPQADPFDIVAELLHLKEQQDAAAKETKEKARADHPSE